MAIMLRRVLSRAYFNRPTLRVARSLLGKYLIRANGSTRITTKIIEVEAYVGPDDRASHASRGRTKRTDVMFGQPGVAYVYFIYGMYHCFNVVTEREGYPAAILIRAVEPAEGQVCVGGAPMAGPPPTLIDGPGRVCRYLQIDRKLNQLDLTLGQTLWIEDRGERVPASAITAYPRIGVDYAGEWATKLWRFRLHNTRGKRQ
ncbi:MAG: DNA-3-methyladenine glycosylase [Nitrospiraceae bacterium]